MHWQNQLNILISTGPMNKTWSAKRSSCRERLAPMLAQTHGKEEEWQQDDPLHRLTRHFYVIYDIAPI